MSLDLDDVCLDRLSCASIACRNRSGRDRAPDILWERKAGMTTRLPRLSCIGPGRSEARGRLADQLCGCILYRKRSRIGVSAILHLFCTILQK